MMAATHRLGGMAAGMAVSACLKPDTYEVGIVLAGAVLGSLLPDIDNSHSSISRKWAFVSFLVTMGQAVIRGLSKLLPKRMGNHVRSLICHRGLTHSLPAVLLAAVVIVLVGHAAGADTIGTFAAIGVAAGMISHLLFDMFAGGVPLFMPFSTKRIVLAKIKTGGVAEWLFRITLIMAFLYLGWEVIPWSEVQKLLHV